MKLLRKYFSTLLYLLVANLAMVLGLVLFLGGNGIAAGGFSGIAIIINYMVPMPIGLFTMVLTLPFLVWSWFVRGREFTVLTAVSTLMYMLLDEALTFLPLLTEDLLLASICGGLLYGLGAYLFLRCNASSGGTDLLARIFVNYKRDFSLGTMILITDGLVILASMLVAGDIEIGIYAVISLAVCSVTTDMLIHSANKASLFLIITKKDPAVLSHEILFKLERGVTRLDATGMYSKLQGLDADQHVLMVVVKPRETWRLEDLVRRTDPEAFTIHCPANSISGYGFDLLQTTSENK